MKHSNLLIAFIFCTTLPINIAGEPNSDNAPISYWQKMQNTLTSTKNYIADSIPPSIKNYITKKNLIIGSMALLAFYHREALTDPILEQLYRKNLIPTGDPIEKWASSNPDPTEIPSFFYEKTYLLNLQRLTEVTAMAKDKAATMDKKELNRLQQNFAHKPRTIGKLILDIVMQNISSK